MSFTIQQKLLSVLGLILAVALFSGGVNLYSIWQADESVHLVEEITVTKASLAKLREKANDTHTSLSTFISSGDLAEKDAYQKQYTETLSYLSDLKSEIENKQVLTYARSFETDFKFWGEEIAGPQLVYMQKPQTVDMARLIENSEQNQTHWDKIQKESRQIFADLDRKATQANHQLEGSMDVTTVSSLASLILTSLVACGAAIFVMIKVSRPLQKLVETTNSLVRKDWQAQIDDIDRADEIGEMAKALVLFRDSGIENERLAQAQKEQDELKIERAQKIEALIAKFKEDSDLVARSLEDATQNMSQSSVTMKQVADRTNHLSQDVSHAAEGAGANVNSVSAATEQLTASIQEISQQLTGTNKLSLEAREVTQNTVERMKILDSSAKEIESVIALISDIAEQTNLLALNATIEAARAGDAGKGFAVVANEVKNLAAATTQGTDQVRAQIDRIQSDTSEALTFIERISSSIENLTEGMTTIAAAMEEQTSATLDISRNVSEASTMTNDVVTNMADVHQATQKTQETSDHVRVVADDLSTQSQKLKSNIDEFVQQIQAV